MAVRNIYNVYLKKVLLAAWPPGLCHCRSNAWLHSVIMKQLLAAYVAFAQTYAGDLNAAAAPQQCRRQLRIFIIFKRVLGQFRFDLKKMEVVPNF